MKDLYKTLGIDYIEIDNQGRVIRLRGKTTPKTLSKDFV